MITVFCVKDCAPILAEDHPVYVDMAKPMKGACSVLYFQVHPDDVSDNYCLLAQLGWGSSAGASVQAIWSASSRQ
jgi:hypothetical protein